jgi:hypothetical protein
LHEQAFEAYFFSNARFIAERFANVAAIKQARQPIAHPKARQGPAQIPVRRRQANPLREANGRALFAARPTWLDALFRWYKRSQDLAMGEDEPKFNGAARLCIDATGRTNSVESIP